MAGLFSYPKRKLKNLLKEGEFKEAIELGKSLEKKSPNDADLFFIMGSIYYILADAKNALHYLDKAIEIYKYDTETLLLKANTHFVLKEFDKVLDCCEKILEVEPKNKEVKEVLDKLENN